MTAPGTIRLMGGAALTLAYGLDRATEDADLLLDDAEAHFLTEHCGFGDAIANARVPAILEDVFRETRPRIEALLRTGV
ncbi:MAG: nucleotidyl transferase AbiEii/AbiGii toxin family protein [Myxococcaceae bacterium]